MASAEIVSISAGICQANDHATTLEQLVSEMVAHDREEAAKEALLRREGFQVVGSMENPPTVIESGG